MHYIDTKPFTMHLLAQQREDLTNLQKDILKKYEIKVSLSELVRQALSVGLPLISENEQLILNKAKIDVYSLNKRNR